MDAVAVRIEGQGTLESAWERCAWLEALPSVEADTVLLGARRLLVVSPHPDDEVLGCGGLMQAAAAQGCAVRGVGDGRRGVLSRSPTLDAGAPARCATPRAGPAMQALGMDATHVTSLGLPDGKVARYEADLALYLSTRLSPVTSCWRRGCTMRIRTTRRRGGLRGRQQPAAASDPCSIPSGLAWLDAAAAAGPWTNAQRIALCPAARARKQQAMAAFATQTGEAEALGREPILPEHVLARFRRGFEVLIG